LAAQQRQADWKCHFGKGYEQRHSYQGKAGEPYDGAPQSWADRLNEAWADLKTGLVRGFSIGFNPLEQAQIKDTFSYRYTSWEWLELSPVTIPANAEATIQTVKSIDTELRVASDQRRGVVVLDQDTIRRVRRPKSGVIYLD
jgi:hypothetical protein